MKYDLVTVGHIVLDYIKRGARVKGPQPGGPCVYSSLAAGSLGARAGIVSKVGRDFGNKRISWLKHRGISVANLKVVHSATTRFQINYENGQRTMRVASTCDSLVKEDFVGLPQSRAIHIGPVLGEVPVSIAHDLAATDSVVALDPQGYVRKLAADGTVRMSKWKNPKLLRSINVLKVSDYELSAIPASGVGLRKISKLGSDAVLWTRGARGIILWSRDDGAFDVPVYPVRVRNPTGAGDVRLGAFLVTWIRTSDLLWSVSVGAAVASFLVERARPLTFAGQKQVEKRATAIFHRAKRI